MLTSAVGVVFLLPLSLLRSVDSLSRVSIASVALVFVLIVLVSIELGTNKSALCEGCNVDFATFARPSVSSQLGVFVFSFNCAM